MLANLHLEVVQGDDHLAIDGRALAVSGAGGDWPDSVDSVKLIVHRGCVIALELDGDYQADPAQVSFDLERRASLKLACGLREYDLEIRALLTSGSVVTLARGWLTVHHGGL